jgi:hypothetical protein
MLHAARLSSDHDGFRERCITPSGARPFFHLPAEFLSTLFTGITLQIDSVGAST